MSARARNEDDSSDSDEKDTFLRSPEGEMFILRDDDYVHFSDFTLKILAEVEGSASSEGYWLCGVETKIHKELESRDVILPASAFDSNKEKFIKALRVTFSRGSFSLSGECQPKDIHRLYLFLKKEYQSGPRRQCNLITHVGFQGEDYWYLSKEDHFENGNHLAEGDHRFFCDRFDLDAMSIKIENQLITSPDHLKHTLNRFFLLSKKAFTINEHAFLAAAAFVIWRIVCNADCAGTTGKSAANIGLIIGKDKSIGKTTALEILAYCQGVTKREHPLLVSLGDQRHCGTSLKKLSKLLGSSTFVAFLDDGEMNSQLAESLLQLQGGFSQGSLTQGNIIPKGSVILTSNTSELPRLLGRVIKFPFKKSANFSREVELATEELSSLVKQNRGFLTLWAIRYATTFIAANQQLLLDLVELLSGFFPDAQTRWMKGVAGVILAQAMLCMTSDQKDHDLVSIFKQHVSFSGKDYVPDSLDKLQLAIFNKIQRNPSCSEILQWLNPNVKVNTGEKGKFCPAIALKKSEVNQWQDLSSQEVSCLTETLGKHGCNVSIPFGNGGQTTFKDLRSRNKENIVMKKGIKIPKNKLNEKLVHLIDLVTGSCTDQFQGEKETLLGPESLIRTEIEDCNRNLIIDKNVLNKLQILETKLQQLLEGNNVMSGGINSECLLQRPSTSQVNSVDHTPCADGPNQPVNQPVTSQLLHLDNMSMQSVFSEAGNQIWSWNCASEPAFQTPPGSHLDNHVYHTPWRNCDDQSEPAVRRSLSLLNSIPVQGFTEVGLRENTLATGAGVSPGWDPKSSTDCEPGSPSLSTPEMMELIEAIPAESSISDLSSSPEDSSREAFTALQPRPQFAKRQHPVQTEVERDGPEDENVMETHTTRKRSRRP